jgi:DNA-binding LacI/PurR family transcriptional regulator
MTESSERQRPATMADVARLAGVSTQTVSRVMNDYPFISTETRSRVERAVHRLGYRPNRAARTLATSRSRTIGVVATDYRSYGPSAMLWAVEEAAQESGYEVAVQSLRVADDATIRQSLDRLAGQSVEGIVYLAPQDAAHAAFLTARDVPVVTYVGFRDGREHPVQFDSTAGSRVATEHLIAIGHRRIGHIAGDPGFAVSGARIEGWRQGLAEAGLVAQALVAGDWSAGGGYHAARELLERFPDVTAVHVANDHMALGALLAFQQAGRRVPEDISVVGFDDVPEAAYLVPPLTTVRQDFADLGRRCIAALLAEMQGAPRKAAPPIVPALVVRASTAPPASD